MPRKLRPCGTYAAYARHLRNNEKPCEPCSAANRERSNAAPSGFNNYEREMARALDARPPQILWRRKPNGIWVAVSVRDPHSEAAMEQRRRDRAFAAEAREAAEVATRFQGWEQIGPPECTDENLLNAARTEI